MQPDSQPIFERLPGENSREFQSFVAYRDLGESRSLRKVADQTRKAIRLLERWSSEWRWSARCAAYDSHLDTQAIEARIKALADMQVRHINLAVSAQTVAARRIQQLLRQDPDGSFPELKKMSPQAVAAFMETAVKLERLARGETTENVGHREGVDAPTGPHPLTALVLASPESIRFAALLARSIGYDPGGDGGQPALPPGPDAEPDRNDLSSFLGRLHHQG